MEVMIFICNGFIPERIGDIMHISRATVNWHLKGLYDTFHVKNREELVKTAFALKLVSDKDLIFYDREGKAGPLPEWAQRVELKAYTLAGFIPWCDEFEEDVFIDLGAIFLDEFTEAYGQEFDRQCLLANETPFTGAMKADGVTTVTLGSADITKLTWKDFRDAVYKVPAEERKDCAAA
jgi:DNA-binding CsgD family transcriptional regulator